MYLIAQLRHQEKSIKYIFQQLLAVDTRNYIIISKI